MLSLQINDLSQTGFAPFGQMLAFDNGKARVVNEGRARRADTAARLSNVAGEPVLAIYRAERQYLPLDLTLMERHPFSSQAFVSIDVPRFLVVVAPKDPLGLPDLACARAFVGTAGQGINYKPGVWHAPITALDREGDFLMLMWERGGDDDCVIHRSPTTLVITA